MKSTNLSKNPVTIVQPVKGFNALDLKELFQYRELLWVFIWREIKVRYKQTILGASWAVIQPFVTMVIFSIFFGRIVNVSSDDIPYPIFSYAALLPWTFFTNSLRLGSNSLITNSTLITKVYFPRLVLPASIVISGLLDFCISFIVLLGMMLFYGIYPGLEIFFFPLFLFQVVVVTLGAGIWLSALNVQYRDVRYVVPFLTQVWLFITPVIYPTSLLSGPMRVLYSLNPMVGVIEGFRWTLLGSIASGKIIFGMSALTSLILLASGLLYFRQVEKDFADVV
ncbi:MAG: ABC transporter permease [Anaerolineae bacterium]|nr:ABC transporter permease [Anaerolineae bacterium]